MAELRVRDTGVGIPADAIPKLFERFNRVPNMPSRTHEGSGIGLALVYELVKLHGGSVRAESTVGQGSTFVVSIPFGQSHLASGQMGGSRSLASTAVGAKPFVEEALRWLPDSGDSVDDMFSVQDELLPVPCPPASPGVLRPRVLVADDNSDMRQYLSRLLSEQYEVETAADGQAALQAARKAPPDLIVSDVMMPILDGFDLLKALRSDERTRTIPVVLLSARAGEESRVEGIEAGADDYLIKPFSARELLARVSGRLEIARLQRDRETQLRISQAELERRVQERTQELFNASQELRELSARILQAQDEERRRIARELHDGAGQLLAALGMEASNLASERDRLSTRAAVSLSNIESFVAQMTKDIRTMSHLLYPPLLDEVGLQSALTEYVNGFAERSGIQVSLDLPAAIDRLDRDYELSLFRIVQECLTNIHRHSGSKTASIRIVRDDRALVLEVRDEGRGICSLIFPLFMFPKVCPLVFNFLMPKYIFVTGGVVSSVGKGITVASIGTILKAGRSASPFKNSTPTSTSTPAPCPLTSTARSSSPRTAPRPTSTSATTSALSISSSPRTPTSPPARYTARSSPRSGAAISWAAPSRSSRTSPMKSKQRFKKLAEKSEARVILIEVGGTVGDIEGQPFLEAIRQMRNDVGPRQCTIYPRDPAALSRLHPGAQDQAHPAQRQRAPAHGHPAGCHRLPQRLSDLRKASGTRFRSSATWSKEAVIPLPTVPTIYEVPLVLEAARAWAS